MVKTNETMTILQRCVCLTLSCSYLGNNRKVKLDALKDAMDGQRDLYDKAFHATMKLVDNKALRGPNGVIGRAKAYVRSRAVQSHRIFGEGSVLVPTGLVTSVDARLQEFATELDVEARLVAQRYAGEMAQQAARLGKLFNARLYLTPDQVAGEWALDWSYVSFAAPERLETVDRAIYEASREKWDAKMGEAYHEVRLALREGARQFAREFVRRLSPGDDGKPKIVKATGLLENLRDFLETFDLRNITDDAELAGVVARLRAVTHGLDPADLNDTGGLREQVLGSMAAAAQALDGLVATGRRAISFGPLRADAA